MQKYHSLEEVATLLAVEQAEVSGWIENGELRAFHLGNGFRVAEDDLERFLATRVHHPSHVAQADHSNGRNHMGQVRLEKTFAGRSQFRVSGTVRNGARIWPGKMQSGLFFSREFFERMLANFQGKDIAAGLIFSGPEAGSLGEWIQENLPTKMNPTYCVAGLLAAEGYAERREAGVIRFFPDAFQRLRQ
jgi:excisionase family DNA binding protein